MKKKIRLDLDALKVESFMTSGGAEGEEGTVFAMANTVCEWTCNGVSPSCDGAQGCGHSLQECNDYTNGGTCGPQNPTFGCLSQIGCYTWEETCVGENTCNPCAASCDSEDCMTH